MPGLAAMTWQREMRDGANSIFPLFDRAEGEAVTIAYDPRQAGKGADDMLVAEGGQVWRLTPWRAGGDASDGAVLSPMPGRIIAVAVAAGEAVVKGQKLLTLEAMKMEHSLVAPFDGTIAQLNASEGGQQPAAAAHRCGGGKGE